MRGKLHRPVIVVRSSLANRLMMRHAAAANLVNIQDRSLGDP